MFNKNGKFKLWFWGTMLVILGGLGISGLVYKLTTSDEDREQARFSNKTTEQITIEGNSAPLGEEENLKNFAISIFNDSHNYLEINKDGTVTLSPTGKITTTAKYMYLNNEINFSGALTDDNKKQIVEKTKVLFGDYVKIENFNINFSNGVCGSSGYDSGSGTTYGNDNKSSDGNCPTPYMYYVISKVKKDKDTYAVLVKGLYVSETEYPNQEESLSDLTCTNSTKFNRTVSLYKDKLLQNKLGEGTNVDVCCDEDACPTGASMKIVSAITSSVNNNGNSYYLRFEKNKDGKGFKLAKIEAK